MCEPDIIINGQMLTEAETMTLRVALETFGIDINKRDNGLEPARATVYRNCVEQIRDKINAG